MEIIISVIVRIHVKTCPNKARVPPPPFVWGSMKTLKGNGGNRGN